MDIILVNKNNKYDFNTPNDFIKVNNSKKEKISIDKTTYKNYLKLKNYLKKYNYNISIESGFRSFLEQKELFYEIVSLKGISHALKYVALPGYSEHHTGQAIDICLIKNNKVLYDFDINDKKFFNILHKSLSKFGFILRYPSDKENITQYNYEPWHIRYVGKKIAKYIFKNNMCLEEYLSCFNAKYKL